MLALARDRSVAAPSTSRAADPSDTPAGAPVHNPGSSSSLSDGLLGSATTVLPMLFVPAHHRRWVQRSNTRSRRAAGVARPRGWRWPGALLTLLEVLVLSPDREGLTQRLRCQLFDRVSTMPLAFFTRSGRVISPASPGTSRVRGETFTSTFSQALRWHHHLLLVLGSMLGAVVTADPGGPGAAPIVHGARETGGASCRPFGAPRDGPSGRN